MGKNIIFFLSWNFFQRFTKQGLSLFPRCQNNLSILVSPDKSDLQQCKHQPIRVVRIIASSLCLFGYCLFGGSYRLQCDLYCHSQRVDIILNLSLRFQLAGEYAELLLIQSNRKAEGERMKEWAEDAWRNRRLTLAQALEFSEHSKPTVVDTRIGRVMQLPSQSGEGMMQ